MGAWQELLGGHVPSVGQRRGRPPRVPLTHVLPALTFHFMNGAGTLAQHFFQLFNYGFADSSLSDRRARLPWEVFTDVMRRALRPRATGRHKGAFWRHWRLVALDGTQFSVTNTPQVKQQMTKAKSRRGRAAFAKLWTVVLLEIGLHNPLAASVGRRGQSEWELSRGLLAQLPKKALLLADRLYGCAAFIAEAMAACQRVGSHLLIRVRTHLKVQTRRRYQDGSRLIRVGLRQKGNDQAHLQADGPVHHPAQTTSQLPKGRPPTRHRLATPATKPVDLRAHRVPHYLSTLTPRNFRKALALARIFHTELESATVCRVRARGLPSRLPLCL